MSIIIRPDYVTPLVYPEGSQPLHLEDVGPAEHNLSALGLVLPEEVFPGAASWVQAYPSLLQNGEIESYLGLRDGRELMKLDIKVFREFTGDRPVVLLKGVVLLRDGVLHVPFLCEGGGRVVVGWDRLHYDWSSHFPAARSGS